MKVEFSHQTFEKHSHIKFTEILLIGVELFHTDGETDMTNIRGLELL